MSWCPRLPWSVSGSGLFGEAGSSTSPSPKGRHDLAIIEAFAVVVTDVRSRRQAAIELGLLNRDCPMIKLTMQDRHVIQTVALPGYPFVPMQLLVLPASFANVLAQASGDLSLRTGGRVA